MREPTSLTVAFSERAKLRSAIDIYQQEYEVQLKAYRAKLAGWNEVIKQHKSGLDAAKISLARTVLKIRGTYANAGTDRASVISDAISWFATGKAPCYHQLTNADYGTKNFDGWRGQRSDHERGGPRHGSLCFQLGLKDRRAEITDDQREACLYFLNNIAEIEAVSQTTLEQLGVAG